VFTVWVCALPGVTGTSIVWVGWTGSTTCAATVPSVVVIVVSEAVVSTWNSVPRTDAVLAGVRTSYFEFPAMSFATTCQVRPTFCVIRIVVAPCAAKASSMESSVPGSIVTVDPSKYVSTARASTAVLIASPDFRTSPSTAVMNCAPAP